MDNQNSNNNEYLSLPLASMTFGKEHQPEFTFNNNSSSNNNSLKNELNNNLTLKNNQNIFKEIPEEKKESSNGNNNILYENEKTIKKKSFPHLSTFSNKTISHNSFIPPIIYGIYYMKLIRNYILYEAEIPNEKNNLLYHLKKILLLMPENKKIDLTQFRNCLAENFQNRRKFLIDIPDDPSDLYFILINSIHSNFLQISQKEISDYSCREKCCSHHFLWMDIARIDFCECGGNKKRLFSNHNYIFDININKIFDLCKNYILINDINGSGIKVKERNNSNNNFFLYEFYEKLFFYYKFLINNIQSDCPVNGIRCNINKTPMKLLINNNPSYLVFYLQQNLNYNLYDILKNFILIPKTFNISTLFELSNFNGKNYNEYSFNLLGCVLLKSSNTFSSFFKDSHSCSWLYYDEEYVFSFNNLFEVIVYCLKNSLIPIMLFYKGNMNPNNNNMYDTINDNISSEQFNILEKYALNADLLYKVIDNRIRINEDFLGNYNFITSKNTLINSYETTLGNKDFYICYNCQNKNKLNEKTCQKCGSNNIEIINGILNNHQSEVKSTKHNNINKINILNNINISNQSLNNNNNNSSSNSLSNHLNIIPITLSNSSNLSNNSNINSKKKKNLRIDEDDDDTIDSQIKKNYDMPKPYIPKKDIPVKIKPNIMNNINNMNNISNNSIPQSTKNNKKNTSPKNNKNYISKTNANKILTNSNQYVSQAIKKKQKELKKIKSNENEDRIIPYEIASKKRVNTTNKSGPKISYAEIKSYNNRYNQELNIINHNNMKLSPNIFNNYSNNWYCPNCKVGNKGNNNKCRNCNYIKINDNSISKIASTPKNSHSKLFERRNINNERKYSERKYRNNSNEKKILRNSHSKSPNGLHFSSGNNNFNQHINDNISHSNVNVNYGMRSSEPMKNFKRKNKYY